MGRGCILNFLSFQHLIEVLLFLLRILEHAPWWCWFHHTLSSGHHFCLITRSQLAFLTSSQPSTNWLSTNIIMFLSHLNAFHLRTKFFSMAFKADSQSPLWPCPFLLPSEHSHCSNWPSLSRLLVMPSLSSPFSHMDNNKLTFSLPPSLFFSLLH